MNYDEKKDLLKRVKEGAEKKEFRVNNIEEWGFICGAWVDYILKNSNLPDRIYKGRETWMMKKLNGDNIEPFKQKLMETFTKQYMENIGETEFLNGIFLSILDYKPEDDEKWSDSAQAFSIGLISELIDNQKK